MSTTTESSGRARRPLRRRVEKKARKLLGMREAYQGKRAQGTEQRWEMIRSNLTSEDRNLLDVGCDVGALTRRAADAGLLALGVDNEGRIVRRARALHRDVPNAWFLEMDLGPDSIATLPGFDVTLCLSVHHYWARAYGWDRSWEMMATLLAKTRHRLFFEPASIRKKYKEAAPDIVDNDRESITEVAVRQLKAAGAGEYDVRYLGETPCLGLEPFRLLFVAERR